MANRFGGSDVAGTERGLGFNSTPQMDYELDNETVASATGAMWSSGGVIEGKGSSFAATPTAPASLVINMGTGGGTMPPAFMRQRQDFLFEPTTVTVDAVHASLPRIAVVGRRAVQGTEGEPEWRTHVLYGAPASAPLVPVNPYTTEDDFFYPILQIRLRAGTTTILASDIEPYPSRRALYGENPAAEGTVTQINVVTSLPERVTDGEVLYVRQATPAFDFSDVNIFYAMTTHGDYLYVVAEYSVFGVGVNLVKRYHRVSGLEDRAFTFSIEGTLAGNATNGVDPNTPNGLGVTDDRIYISRRVSSASSSEVTIYAFDHMGSRQSADDIGSSSNRRFMRGMWASADHFYYIGYNVNANAIFRSELDGTGETRISPNSGQERGLVADPANSVWYALDGNEIESGNFSQGAVSKVLTISGVTGTPNALALDGTTFIIGTTDGSVAYRGTVAQAGDIFEGRGGVWVKTHSGE